jgi:hypothetical protein
MEIVLPCFAGILICLVCIMTLDFIEDNNNKQMKMFMLMLQFIVAITGGLVSLIVVIYLIKALVVTISGSGAP